MSYLLAAATTLAAAISENPLGLRVDQSDLLHKLSPSGGRSPTPHPQCSCLHTAEHQRASHSAAGQIAAGLFNVAG